MQQQDEQVQVSGYKITKTIGKGTFGKVRIATHIATQQKVAVKILEKELIKDPSNVERISREIKILKKVYHAFIITLYEIVQTQNRLYLFMEYANEGDLFGKICSQRKLKQSVAVTYYLQLMWGLKYLHEHGITHRDLKPENLLLQNNLIKIADFGLGNFFEPNLQLKTACGSPCYAAPEMISKLSYHPPKVDVWSSGIVLYAMIMGYLPFEDSNIHNLYNKIKKGQFKIPDWVSPSLKELFRGVLAVDPQKRLSVDQIIHHPWIQSHHPNIQIVPTIKLDPEHITSVATEFKLDREKLNKSLATKKHNSLTTTFYLWLKKEQRRKIDSNLTQSLENKLKQNSTKEKKQIDNKVKIDTEHAGASKNSVQIPTRENTMSKDQSPIKIEQSSVETVKIEQQQSKVNHDIQEKIQPPIKVSEQKPILIQEEVKIELEVTKKKPIDQTPLRKVGRMQTEGMKKTAQRAYQRSGSRQTEISVRLTAAKKNRLLLKRIEKKPRLLNSAFFFEGHVEQLRDFVKKVEPKNNNINVQYYEVSLNVLYIVKTNIDAVMLKNQLLQRLEK